MIPRPDQEADVKAILAHPKRGALVATVTGGGKTLVGVETMLRANPNQLLILAPVNTQDSWTRTVLEQSNPESTWGYEKAIALLVCSGVSGSNEHYANLKRLQKGEPGWYFIGWEMASQIEYQKLAKLDGLILDEVHRGANPGRINKTGSYANMIRALGRRVAKNGGYRLAFSATPAGNKIENLFAPIEAVWPKDSIRSFREWTDKHFYTGIAVVDSRGTQVRQIGREKKPGKVVAKLPLYIRHEARERCCKFHPHGIQADLPERVVHRVGVDLTPRQRDVYDQMEADMLAWIEDHDWPIMANGYPMVQYLRLLQICLAQPTTTLATRLTKDKMSEEQYIQVKYALDCESSKIDALKDIVADIDPKEPILVLTHSAGIIPAVAHQLRKKKLGTVAEWHGGIPHKERQRSKEYFLDGALRIIVAQIDAIAEGTDGLQRVCSNEIWLSERNSNMSNTQALGRLQRDGQTRTVNSWQIYARDTRELAQYAKLTQNDRVMHDGLKAPSR